MNEPKKILIVRFSSIGDIVLTTPVVRCIKKKYPKAKIHFLTKNSFKSLLSENPYIDKIFTIEKSIKEQIEYLQNENYDFVVDLHKNIRTTALKKQLKKPSGAFSKLNLRKWLLVKFKVNVMPDIHIVDRYFTAVKKLQVVNDNLPCDFFIHPDNEVNVQEAFQVDAKQYIGIAIGAQFRTKRLPSHKLKELLAGIDQTVVLLGGPTDKKLAQKLITNLPGKKIHSACGTFNLQQSASIVKQAKQIISHDTGLMHIASCFSVPIISIWGNTLPIIGMYPYMPENNKLFTIHEVPNLNCRPCSKIGYKSCPKKHFNCMEQQDISAILEDVIQ